MTPRRIAAALLVCAATALLAPAVQAQAQAQANNNYPDKPVRILVPYAPGGGSDAAARLIAAQLSKVLGQPFIVESRPGGNTMIASVAVARGPADGYTLLLTGGSTMSVLPLISEKLPIDPVADLAPVGMVSRFPFVFAVSSQFGATTLADAMARARAKPGDVGYASNGSGTMVHLGMELLAHQAQVKLNHVPYKGFAPAIGDVVAGRVPLMLADWQPIAGPVQAGTIKVLGVTSGQRSPLMPDVPTVAEQGFPGYDLEVWFGLYAPAATPPEIIARLGDAMRRWQTGSEAREQYARIGHEPFAGTPAEMRARIAAERRQFAATIKAANIRAE